MDSPAPLLSPMSDGGRGRGALHGSFSHPLNESLQSMFNESSMTYFDSDNSSHPQSFTATSFTGEPSLNISGIMSPVNIVVRRAVPTLQLRSFASCPTPISPIGTGSDLASSQDFNRSLGSFAYNVFSSGTVTETERLETTHRMILQRFLHGEALSLLIRFVHELRIFSTRNLIMQKIVMLCSSQEAWWRKGVVIAEQQRHLQSEEMFVRLRLFSNFEREIQSVRTHCGEQQRFMDAHEFRKQRLHVERQNSRERRFIDSSLFVQHCWFLFDFAVARSIVYGDKCTAALQSLYSLFTSVPDEHTTRGEIELEHANEQVSIYSEQLCNLYDAIGNVEIAKVDHFLSSFSKREGAAKTVVRVASGYVVRRNLGQTGPSLIRNRAVTKLHDAVKGFFIRHWVFLLLPKKRRRAIVLERRKQQQAAAQQRQCTAAADS